MAKTLLETFEVVLKGKEIRITAELNKRDLSAIEIQCSVSDAVNAFMCYNFGANWRHDFKASNFYELAQAEIGVTIKNLISKAKRR